MAKKAKKHHLKRWELYTILAIVAVVVGLGIWGAIYYVNYVADNQEVISSNSTVTRTEEEKQLAEVKSDLDKDGALDLTGVDNDLKALEAIDLSGI